MKQFSINEAQVKVYMKDLMDFGLKHKLNPCECAIVLKVVSGIMHELLGLSATVEYSDKPRLHVVKEESKQ